MSLAKDDLFYGSSLAPPEIGSWLYGVPVPNVPAINCPEVSLSNTKELPRPNRVIDGSLNNCADFYQDKELSTFQFEYAEVEKTTLIKFSDYDNIGVTAACGISHQFVDFGPGSEGWDTFWMKQEYPSLDKLRFFSAGCWNIPGGFEGGFHEGNSGAFAGTMVAIFGSTGGLKTFEESIGNRNFKMQFITVPEGQSNDLTEKVFVGRPSYNSFWVREDTDPDEWGWIGGRGIQYVDAPGSWEGNPNGVTYGPIVGKVFEFCADEVAGVGALKPDDEPNCNVKFSGSKGPIAFLSNDPFEVTIEQFPDWSGISNGGLLCCVNECGNCPTVAPDNVNCSGSDCTGWS
jgi:hypothetical protein